MAGPASAHADPEVRAERAYPAKARAALGRTHGDAGSAVERHAEADARRDLFRDVVGTCWPAAVIAVLLVLLYLADRGWS